MDGILKEIDLSADETCGLLVGGVTGGGKSMWASGAIAALICQYTPDSLKLVLSDTKKVEFRPYSKIPHLWGPVATDVSSTVSCLEDVCVERERRETLFAHTGVRNLVQYNSKVALGERLPRIVIFIEETKTAIESKESYTEYNDEGRERTVLYSERFQYCKDEIKRLARASGIYLIDSTQSPRQEVLPAGYRGQFSAFLAFRTSRPEESKICLANQYEDACKLLGKGDALYLDNMGLERVQSLYLEPEEIDAIANRVIAAYGSYKPPIQPHPSISEQNNLEVERKRLENLLNLPSDGEQEEPTNLPTYQPTPSNEDLEEVNREKFERIKVGRLEGRSKSQLIQELFEVPCDGGNVFKRAEAKYYEIINAYAHEWVVELLSGGMPIRLIVEKIWSRKQLHADYARYLSIVKAIKEEIEQ